MVHQRSRVRVFDREHGPEAWLCLRVSGATVCCDAVVVLVPF